MSADSTTLASHLGAAYNGIMELSKSPTTLLEPLSKVDKAIKELAKNPDYSNAFTFKSLNHDFICLNSNIQNSEQNEQPKTRKIQTLVNRIVSCIDGLRQEMLLNGVNAKVLGYTLDDVLTLVKECGDEIKRLDLGGLAVDAQIAQTILQQCPQLSQQNLILVAPISSLSPIIFPPPVRSGIYEFIPDDVDSVERLDLSGKMVSNQILKEILERCSNLQAMALENSDFIELDEVEQIENTAWTHATYTALTNKLARCGRLVRKLDVRQMAFTSVELSEILIRCPNISDLQIGIAEHTESDINLADNTPHVKVLTPVEKMDQVNDIPGLCIVDLDEVPHDNALIRARAESLSTVQLAKLKILPKQLLRSLKFCGHLVTKLDFSDFEIPSDRFLGAALQSCVAAKGSSRLKHLNLARCHYVTHNFFLNHYPENISLHTLNLSGCRSITNWTIRLIAARECYKDLKELDLSNCPHLNYTTVKIILDTPKLNQLTRFVPPPITKNDFLQDIYEINNTEPGLFSSYCARIFSIIPIKDLGLSTTELLQCLENWHIPSLLSLNLRGLKVATKEIEHLCKMYPNLISGINLHYDPTHCACAIL